nr:GHKL domain-containing protein [uncultured Mogibacterium sp.]
MIIENTTKQEKVNISQIFEEGYSSKGKGRGIGLHNVSDILAKYPFSSVVTRSADHQFSQTVIFRK